MDSLLVFYFTDHRGTCHFSLPLRLNLHNKTVSIKALTNQTRVPQWLRLRIQQCCKIQCLKI